MDRDFERFRGGATPPASKRIHVTMSPAGLILINRNMYNAFGKPAAVYLNYSRERDIIAIEHASPRSVESFPVIANNSNWRINAAPFCRNFGIRIDAQLKFINPDIIGNALYLKFGETIIVGGRVRKKKKN